MVFLPILQRGFQRASRRRQTYWMRMSAAMAGAGFGILTLLSSLTTPATTGRSLFALTSAISFWLCFLVGVFTTSVCLSEERRQGTLGFLFLTPLKGYDVVIGKLVSVCLNTVQSVMGAVPVMALSMVLGGVSVGEFWRMVTVLLNTLLFSLACGMFASSIILHPGRAMAATVALLTVMTAPSVTALAPPQPRALVADPPPHRLVLALGPVRARRRGLADWIGHSWVYCKPDQLGCVRVRWLTFRDQREPFSA